MANWSNPTAGEGRRRSQRVILSVPVTVTGDAGKGSFTEQTQTLVINAHGALIPLAAKISMGQKLKIKSVTSPQPQDCTVVYVGPHVDGRTQFGVEFATPNRYFWQIAFPAEDGSTASDEPKASKAPAAVPAGASSSPKPVGK